jgi:tetratricopeptide (TPR) repeat protein
LIIQNFILGIVVVHRRDLFRLAGVMDEKLKVLIDWDLWRRLAALTHPYHVSRITAERYFRESKETSGFGHITNISKVNHGLYSRNRLRILYKKFSKEIENRYVERLSDTRNRALLNFLMTRGERAETNGDIEKARRVYRAAARLWPGDLEMMRNFAFFELFRGNPYAAGAWFDRCLDIGRETNALQYGDILYAAMLKLKTGDSVKALELLEEIEPDQNVPESGRLIEYYRQKAMAA